METAEQPTEFKSPTLTLEAYNPVKAELKTLKEENKRLAFDYKSNAGEKAARSYIAQLRVKKADVGRLKKELKSGARAYCDSVESVAKTLVADFEAMIEVHQKPLDEKAEREEMRVEAHQKVIRRIQDLGNTPVAGPSADIQAAITEIEGTEVDGLEEFIGVAVTEKETALDTLKVKLAQAVQREEKDAELEQLRQEKIEREKREAEELAEKQRIEREEEIARKAADEARAEAEAERQRIEAEAQEAKDRAERAEREKEEAEARANLLEQKQSSAPEAPKPSLAAYPIEPISACLPDHVSAPIFTAKQSDLDKSAAELCIVANIDTDLAKMIVREIAAGQIANLEFVVPE